MLAALLNDHLSILRMVWGLVRRVSHLFASLTCSHLLLVRISHLFASLTCPLHTSSLTSSSLTFQSLSFIACLTFRSLPSFLLATSNSTTFSLHSSSNQLLLLLIHQQPTNMRDLVKMEVYHANGEQQDCIKVCKTMSYDGAGPRDVYLFATPQSNGLRTDTYTSRVQQNDERVPKYLWDFSTRCQKMEGCLKKNWNVDGFRELFAKHIGTPKPTAQENRRREQRKRKAESTENKTSKKAKTDDNAVTKTPLVEVTTEEEAFVAFANWREPLKQIPSLMISKRLAREHSGFAPDHKTVVAIRQYCKGLARGSIEYILTSPQYRQWERSKVHNAEEKDESIEEIVNAAKQLLAKMMRDDDSTTQHVDQDGSHAEVKKETKNVSHPEEDEGVDQARDVSHPEEKDESVQDIVDSMKKMVAKMMAE
jgi:hypothetical protein